MVPRSHDLEDEVARAFGELGWRVVNWLKLAPRARIDLVREIGASRVIWRQFNAAPLDLLSGTPRVVHLDFAHVGTLTYMEVDGYNRVSTSGKVGGRGGHVTWSGFHRDRERDRMLAFAGWRGLRYGPGDLKRPEAVIRAAQQFIEFVQLVGSGGKTRDG